MVVCPVEGDVGECVEDSLRALAHSQYDASQVIWCLLLTTAVELLP